MDRRRGPTVVQEAEVEAVVSALRGYGVLTRARLAEVSGAVHWSDSGFRRRARSSRFERHDPQHRRGSATDQRASGCRWPDPVQRADLVDAIQRQRDRPDSGGGARTPAKRSRGSMTFARRRLDARACTGLIGDRSISDHAPTRQGPRRCCAPGRERRRRSSPAPCARGGAAPRVAPRGLQARRGSESETRRSARERGQTICAARR